MSFSVRLWAMTIACFTAFSAWIFLHDRLLPGLSPVASSAMVSVVAWVFGIAGTIVINSFHDRAEKLAEKAVRDDTAIQMASGIAHELNQPLTIIISTCELMARRDPCKDDLRPYEDQILAASERMSTILHKMERMTIYRSKSYVGGVRIVDMEEDEEEVRRQA